VRVGSLQRDIKSPSDDDLINVQIGFAVVKTGVPEDRLYCLYVAGRGQDFCSKRAPATVGRTQFDTGLPVAPADRLLQRIAGPVHLGSTVQLSMFEREFKGLPFVRHDEF